MIKSIKKKLLFTNSELFEIGNMEFWSIVSQTPDGEGLYILEWSTALDSMRCVILSCFPFSLMNYNPIRFSQFWYHHVGWSNLAKCLNLCNTLNVLQCLQSATFWWVCNSIKSMTSLIFLSVSQDWRHQFANKMVYIA